MEKLKRYNAAIYCRLSKDDDLRSGESSSISTQKLMLEKYVRFDFLINEYEKEQKIESAERSIKDLKNSKVDLTAWIKLIQKYTHIDKLDRTILGELIDKITVGETKTIDNKKTVDITIYYKFIGAIG